MKEVKIPVSRVPTVTVIWDEGKIIHVWYHNQNLPDTDVIDLLEYLNIYEIRRVINADNKTAVELVIDAYLTEKDHLPLGGDMSELAEPENGNEEETPDEETPDEAAETETKPEGEESETSE